MPATRARLLAIFGPTASGKSALAHAAALALGGEIVVADPFQRYRGLEIAADAPDERARAEVPYHLVGDLEPEEGSSAGAHAASAARAIEKIIGRGRVPIVAGGSGLYLRGALADLDHPPPVSSSVRAEAEALVARAPEAARAELRRRDPGSAERVDMRNPRRLARALELALSGASAAEHALWTRRPRHPTLIVALDRPREVLDRMIAARVERELRDGLVAEISELLDRPGLSREAGQIIGAREVAALRAGELSADELPARLSARTRRLARRQLAWQRRLEVDAVVHLGDRPTRSGLGVLLRAWRGDPGARAGRE